MQTFLPYPDYKESARVLDSVRLLNQRRESMSLVTSIETNSGWINHPCTRLWQPYLRELCLYSSIICIECLARGFNDNCFSFFILKLEKLPKTSSPHWMNNKEFHRSHRANLLRKDFNYYSQFFDKWEAPVFLPYYWPL